MWRLFVLVEILNLLLIILLSLRIHQLEDEKRYLFNEFIKEINKIRNGEKKNVK